MKKVILGFVIATAAVAASADVGVSAVRDTNLNETGVRLQADLPFAPFGAHASVTHINDGYTRYGVGKSFDVASVGTVKVAATVAGVYQDTKVGENGYGLTAGIKATLPVTKTVDVTAGVERFVGQDRVSGYNGNVVAVGLNVKF